MTDPFLHARWIHATNIYEVNLRQYTQEGTLAAFSREMPRLKDMGIEVLWFMPITPISIDKRKGTLGSYYACSDYTAINPEFGSLDDFKQLVRLAHALGLRVIIDWVGNHTGWDHRWTREHPDFYRKNNEGQFYEAHGWEDVIDLNYDNPGLRQAVIEAMTFWIRECDIDGFRCDMAMLVPLNFWREARTAIDRLKKDLFWLAECEEIDYHEVFDATYTWKFLHKMEAIWRKETGLGGLDEVLEYYASMFPQDALRAFFTSNHDENSHSGSEYERMGDAAKAYGVLCCTWNGLPLIYSGQELPNTKRLKFFDKDQIDWKVAAGVGEGGGAEKGLGVGRGAGAGEVLGAGRGAEGEAAVWALSCELHGFYKALLELRKRNPALRAADPETIPRRLYTGVEDKCFAFARRAGEGEVLVVLNFSADTLSVPVGEWQLSGRRYQDIFTGAYIDLLVTGAVRLAPWSYWVFEKK